MMKRIFFLFTALTLSTGLWANSITYTATEALIVNNCFNLPIYGHAYASSTKVGVITFDGDVTTICEDGTAFENPSALLSIILPDTIKKIGSEAFLGCSNLTVISIPKAVTEIGITAFVECSALNTVTFEGTACQNNIGMTAFLGVGKNSATTLTLPDDWNYSAAPESISTSWHGGYFKSNLYSTDETTDKQAAIAEITAIVKDFPTSAFLQELLAEEKVKINNAVNRQEVNERKLVAIGILESALSIYPKAFAEGDASGYQRGKAEGLGSLGTEQSGPAVRVTKGTESIILYSPEKVEYMIIQK